MGVNVNAVAPGFVDTDMTQALKGEQREQDCPAKRAEAPGRDGRCGERGGVPSGLQIEKHHRHDA